jgi:RDD family
VPGARNRHDGGVTTPALRRIAAWCLDWLIISGYAAALVPLGLALNRSVQLPPAGWNTLSFAVLVLPATLWLTAWEAGARAATPGKRVLRLTVRHGDDQPGWRRSLSRNTLKVALPWELGHTAAYALATSPTTAVTEAVGMACGIGACLIALGYLLSLFVGTGLTPYDRIVGTAVGAA